MSDELRVESFIDEEESDLINSLFLDGVDSSDSILNSQKREGGEKELSGGGEKDAGQSQNVKDPFEGMDDKEDAFEGVSDVGATEEKTAVNEKEVVASEEKEVKVVENEEKNEEVVIEEKDEEKEEGKEEEKEKDEQNAITTNEKEENTTNNEEQEQNNTKPTKPTRRSPRIQNRRKPSPREETTEDAQPENTSVPIDIVEDSVVINPLSSLRVQQDIHISEPRKMTLRERTKKSPTTQRTKKSPTKRTKKSPTTPRTKKSPTRRTKRANTEMLSQPPAVEEAVRKRRRRDTDCETQRSEVGLEERVRDSRNERRSEANARLIELGILRTTTSSDVWRARWQ